MNESLWSKGMYSSSSIYLDGCTADHFPSFEPDPVSSSSDALGVSGSSHRDGVKILPESHYYSSGDTGSSLMCSSQKELGAPRESNAGHLSTRRHPAHGSYGHHDWSFNSGHQAKRARVENIIKGMTCTDVTVNQREEPDYIQEDEAIQERSLHQKLLERSGSEDMSQKKQQHEHLRQLRTKFCHEDVIRESTDNKREEKYPGLNSPLGTSTFDSFTDPCSEFDSCSARKHQGWKKVKLMNYFQSKPERIKLIADVLKYELSRAVSRSVDTIFKSMPLLQTSPNDSETHTPFQSSVCTDDKLRFSCCGSAEVHIPDVQTEALSLVVQKPEVVKASNFDHSTSTAPRHPKSQMSLNHDSTLQKTPERLHSADHQRALRALQEKCSEPGQLKLDVRWNAGKMKSKVNSRSVRSPQSHPVPVDPVLLESLCLPHVKMESDSLMKNNLFMLNEGLTTNHLKKAKLMFFYTRYPSSLVLRTCFHDVQFTRCITSQLIKWFSNFREFYYIQMEKFARNAVMEGVVDVKDLTVNRESELFRALNMHYNKANDFQVPVRFLEVAEITLREFYIAISMGKDRDPSWKKAIYKVICKLDSDVPAELKTHHSN